ncbi:MAG: flagellar basal body rod protein FlgB [Hyphomicrobiales bacterium]
MSLTDLPVLDALRTKMKWHQTRQRVLAENVANADSPDYRARELKPPEFTSMLRAQAPGVVSTRVTDAQHIEVAGRGDGPPRFRTDQQDNFETTPSGNSVVLEEQMMKVAANQMDYQAATTLYSKSINLLRMALGQGAR